MSKDFENLHNSSHQVDERFPSSPVARLYANADRRDLDAYCYTAELRLTFPDGVSLFSVEFSEDGLRDVGEQMLLAALAMRMHRVGNQEGSE